MKLLIAVIQRADAPDLVDAMTATGKGVTRVSSEGGFLHEGNVTLFVGVEDHEVDPVLELIRQHCHTRTRYVSALPPLAASGDFYPTTPIEIQVGGATVFVVAIEKLQRV
jgi:uncharacterized protein YaaQ